MTLFETFAIKHGQILNLPYHQWRYTHALQYLASLGMDICPKFLDLKKVIKPIPNNHELMRCRLDYDGVSVNIKFYEYMPKTIQSFCLIDADINYAYKFANRDELNQLYNKRQHTDEVIIINRGFVSDCSIGNLLFLKKGIWYTPDTPLLTGTQRQYLLDNKKIKLASIKKDDIGDYEKVMMINALNAFDENRAVVINGQSICGI